MHLLKEATGECLQKGAQSRSSYLVLLIHADLRDRDLSRKKLHKAGNPIKIMNLSFLHSGWVIICPNLDSLMAKFSTATAENYLTPQAAGKKRIAAIKGLLSANKKPCSSAGSSGKKRPPLYPPTKKKLTPALKVIVEDSVEAIHLNQAAVGDSVLKAGKISLPCHRQIMDVYPGHSHCIMIVHNHSTKGLTARMTGAYCFGDYGHGQLGTKHTILVSKDGVVRVITRDPTHS
eukprot:scaffold34622_cov162-Amphora_coffeaeformis.AAC.13